MIVWITRCLVLPTFGFLANHAWAGGWYNIWRAEGQAPSRHERAIHCAEDSTRFWYVEAATSISGQYQATNFIWCYCVMEDSKKLRGWHDLVAMEGCWTITLSHIDFVQYCYFHHCRSRLEASYKRRQIPMLYVSVPAFTSYGSSSKPCFAAAKESVSRKRLLLMSLLENWHGGIANALAAQVVHLHLAEIRSVLWRESTPSWNLCASSVIR